MLPRWRPHRAFHGVNWSDEITALASRGPGSMVVEVTAHVVGMCGLLALNGPFNAITHTRNLKAFETRAMAAAVEYKWQTYGCWYHMVQLSLQGFGEPQIRSQKDLVLIPEPVFYRGAHWGLAMHTGF